jgi:hypothetical protein
MLFNKRRLTGLCDRFFRGRDSIVEQGESPCLFAVIRRFVRPQSEQRSSQRKHPFPRRSTYREYYGQGYRCLLLDLFRDGGRTVPNQVYRPRPR